MSACRRYRRSSGIVRQGEFAATRPSVLRGVWTPGPHAVRDAVRGWIPCFCMVFSVGLSTPRSAGRIWHRIPSERGWRVTGIRRRHDTSSRTEFLVENRLPWRWPAAGRHYAMRKDLRETPFSYSSPSACWNLGELLLTLQSYACPSASQPLAYSLNGRDTALCGSLMSWVQHGPNSRRVRKDGLMNEW